MTDWFKIPASAYVPLDKTWFRVAAPRSSGVPLLRAEASPGRRARLCVGKWGLIRKDATSRETLGLLFRPAHILSLEANCGLTQ